MAKKTRKPVKFEPRVSEEDHKSRVILFISLSFLLVLAAFSVYANALSNGFVYDDTFQVLENRWIRDVKYIPEIFTEHVWGFRAGAEMTNYYRPLMHIIYMLNYYVFGLNPWGFHLVNILFHAGVSVLVFIIVLRLLGKSQPSSAISHVFPSFMASLAFVTHPMHTEAVTWVAGIPDLSFTFFTLLSFYFYMRSHTRGNYLISIISFSLAVFCKEPALTLPLLLVAYDFFYEKEEKRLSSRFVRYSPYLFVAVIYLILRSHALGGFAPKERHAELSSFQYVINVFPLFLQYIEKILIPINLNFFYVFRPVRSLDEVKLWLSLIITVFFILISCVAWKKQRTVYFGLIFFAIPLLPVLYIPGLGENTFTERYLYLPSVGWSILIATFIQWAQKEIPKVGKGVAFAVVLLIGLYSMGTIDRNTVWKDNATFYRDTITKSPTASLIRNNYGNILLRKGHVDEAIEQFRAALAVAPDFAKAHSNLAVAYFKRGFTEKALQEFQRVVKLQPANAEAHMNLGVAYKALGSLDNAIEQLQIAVRLQPDHAVAYYNLGRAYREKGLLDKAIEQFEAAVRLEPANSTFKGELAATYHVKAEEHPAKNGRIR